MSSEIDPKFAYLIAFVVISVAVTGYFIGLQSPMNPIAQSEKDVNHSVPDLVDQARLDATHAPSHASLVIPATHYAEMAGWAKERKNGFRTRLVDLKMDIDPLAEIKIIPGQKEFALAMRDQSRAFNGAPPTVPHPIDQTSAAACVACHTNGAKTETLRIPRMSHQFLENCTQCHVENSPQHMPANLFRETTFVGLPAPQAGPRAYEGAPPQIPHSTWMRVDCLSCHGPTGLYGIRSTHPWRQNCQQCHAPSSKLDQVQLDPKPKFLPPLKIK